MARDGVEQQGGVTARIATFIVRWRWAWLALTVILAAVSVARLDRIVPIDPDARIFFAPENPDRQRLDAFEAMFSKDDNLVFLVEPLDGKVFTPKTLALIGEMTEEMWRLPFVRRVNSITNFQHTYAEGDEMIVRDLVEDPANVTPEEAAEAQEIALSRIELRNSMIDPAASITQVQVLFTLPGVNPEVEGPKIYNEAQALIQRVEAANPGVDLRLTGSVALNQQFADSGQNDASSLTPLMFAAILLIVGLALRSFFGVASVLLIIILSALGGLGALGWMGVQLNSVTVLAPLYVMTLAVASAVHILVSVRQHMVDTDDRQEWARRALTEHMGPIVVACVTTAIGFFSLNFSISPPFRQLGNITGFGVLAAMIYTLTLLPALVAILPFRRQTTRPAAGLAMDRLAEFVIARRRPILLGGFAVVAAAAAGVSQLKLEDNFVEYFDESYEFRRDTDYAEERLAGLYQLEFKVDSGREQGINDPAFLKTVDSFAEWLRAQPEVVNVRTLTDTVKRLNMNMHADDPSYMRIPDDANEAAQYLFLYELSIGYGMDLTDQIDVSRQFMRVTFNMRDVTTSDMRDLTGRAEAWLAENGDQSLTAAPTGIVHVFNLISYRDTRAMLTGTAIALVLISAIIMLALRDIRIGLISLIPNVLPAVVGFGLWGYGVGAVTLAIAVVLAATLGIVVDDTVHFLSKYAKARREGKTAEDSVRYAFSKVGMALLVTTVGLVAGFGVLAQSGFAVNGDLAKLTAITITIALVADFLLLPALLIQLDQRRTPMRIPAPAPALVAAGLIGLGLVAFAKDVMAETPEEKGLAIAMEADRRDLGFGDYTVQGQMILRDSQGQSSTRVFRNMIKERPQGGVGDLAVIVFDEPRDVKGTGLLTHANIEPADDDQWLYLPAVKRVKRISSSNRTGKFVSSEFSYEDLGGQEVDDFTYKWLRDEPCPNLDGTCYVSERTPKNSKSGYSKTIVWIDQAEYRLDQVEFYNRRGEFEKVMTFGGYQQYLGKFWRPDTINMQNRQTGKSTELVWSDYVFNAGLEEGDFDAQRLDRMAR
ncbi:MAG: outer membrane lipoprotein-sorting protein [Pikeienuella sp.]|uniref:outer membrane lipoprotein-sorting protein n=1 Tax=Pikeienuella sp. TaxID=2831957 RepID=UPI00391CBAE7